MGGGRVTEGKERGRGGKGVKRGEVFTPYGNRTKHSLKKKYHPCKLGRAHDGQPRDANVVEVRVSVVAVDVRAAPVPGEAGEATSPRVLPRRVLGHQRPRAGGGEGARPGVGVGVPPLRGEGGGAGESGVGSVPVGHGPAGVGELRGTKGGGGGKADGASEQAGGDQDSHIANSSRTHNRIDA